MSNAQAKRSVNMNDLRARAETAQKHGIAAIQIETRDALALSAPLPCDDAELLAHLEKHYEVAENQAHHIILSRDHARRLMDLARRAA